jgi:hypothetical protein
MTLAYNGDLSKTVADSWAFFCLVFTVNVMEVWIDSFPFEVKIQNSSFTPSDNWAWFDN